MQTQNPRANVMLEWMQDTFSMSPDQTEEASKMIDGLVAHCLGVEPPDPFDIGLNDKDARAQVAKRAADAMPRRYPIPRTSDTDLHAIRQAEADVAKWVGALPPQRSVSGTYRLALDQLGVSIPAKGLNRATFLALAARHKEIAKSQGGVAMDAKAERGFMARFPSIARIKKG